MSHDSVNRFLVRERHEPLDLFDEVKPYINVLIAVLPTPILADRGDMPVGLKLSLYFHAVPHVWQL